MGKNNTAHRALAGWWGEKRTGEKLTSNINKVRGLKNRNAGQTCQKSLQAHRCLLQEGQKLSGNGTAVTNKPKNRGESTFGAKKR